MSIPWSEAPPRTDLESWHYARRTNAAQVATNIVGSLVMARAKACDGEWDRPEESELRALADEAFTITMHLLGRLDAEFPRPTLPGDQPFFKVP
jgi:hypothetical protein